ncbi:MAG TPA: tetratricopeptide repeat protein [Ramlibacter sp.]|nr:tetratricopeptide repeat protein [Ramlibacter sp.]
MQRSLLAALFVALSLAGTAHAADTETTPAKNARVDDFAAGKAAVDAKQWKLASDYFRKVVARDARNADAWNLLGYSLRWQERYDDAFAAYDKALALDPAHKGALHYSGIGYLKVGRRDVAEARLAQLQKVCPGCTETGQLAKAVAESKAAAK